MYNVNSMKRFLKILVVITSFFQVVNLYGRSILNQYDEQGNKHGQWVENANIPERKCIYNYNHGRKDGVYYIYDYGQLSYVGKYDDDKSVSFSSFNRGVLMCDFYDFEYGNMQIGQLQFIGRCKCRTYHPNGVIAQQSIIYFDEGGPEMDTAYYPEIRYYDDNGYLYKVE